MYIDQNLLFADTLTTTTSGASTDYLDSVAVSIKDFDANKQPWWVVKTEAAFATYSGTPLVTFQLQTSQDATFADSTTITLAQTAAFTVAQLAANTIMFAGKVPFGLKRYTRVYMSLAGGVLTTASWSSFLTVDVDKNLP